MFTQSCRYPREVPRPCCPPRLASPAEQELCRSSGSPRVQSPVRARFQSVSRVLSTGSASCALGGEVPRRTEFRVPYSQVTRCCVLARSGHREWYRKLQLLDSSVQAGMRKSVLQQKNLLTAGHSTGLSTLHGVSHLWMLKCARAAAGVCDLEIWITLILANSSYVQGLSTSQAKNMV